MIHLLLSRKQHMCKPDLDNDSILHHGICMSMRLSAMACYLHHVGPDCLLDSLQALQGKLDAACQKTAELETQLSHEHQHAVSAEEHGTAVERQLAEEQQATARLAKKRDDMEAELAAQVGHCTLRPNVKAKV